MPEDLQDDFVRDRRERLTGRAEPTPSKEPVAWRKELSERVQNFRERRSQLRNDQNLEFHFQEREVNAAEEPGEENTLEFPPDSFGLDPDIAPATGLSSEDGHLDAETLQQDDEGLRLPDSALVRTDELPLEQASPDRHEIEIFVGPAESDDETAASQQDFQGLVVAPVSRRFMAGLLDGLILLFGAACFAIIFWLAGGHLTPAPLNLAILVLIAGIFVLTYFGMFTAFTYSTPGQIWAGIEVRNMEGWPPQPHEAVLRAFGYLVSFSTFMMGFLWALVDSEGLTWHDQISGTFLTPRNPPAPGEGKKAS